MGLTGDNMEQMWFIWG